MSQPTIKLPAEAPFQADQRAALEAFLPTLRSGQGAWLSGYLAAVDQLTPAAAVADDAVSVPLTILFGSESGNAEGLAYETEKAAKKAGFQAKVFDMGDFPGNKFKDEKNLLIIVSTWGEGDPPDRATDFHAFVMGDQAPRMEGVRFSVCALGDTSYADFCKCGIDFDTRLEALGAQRVFDRVDCDIDFEEPFRKWLEGALEAMARETALNEPVAAPALATVVAPAIPVVQEWSKKNPFPAALKERIVLSGTGSQKETVHYEFDLSGSGMSYEPGDVLCVIPKNDPGVIEDLIEVAGFPLNVSCEHEGKTSALREVLEDFDITNVSKPLMKKYAAIAGNTELDTFLAEDHKSELSDWLWGREIRDLLHAFPARKPLSPESLLGILRGSSPRLYSIASSLKAHPDEVHLTITSVYYTAHGINRKGVCSTYLANRVSLGDKIPVYVHPNKHFKLPENPDIPIIMVGPGTGIAPFRSFVEERAETGAKGKNWLFFGDWTFQYDFLYQLEWQNYLKNGVLTRMDVAFSRDTDRKIYVQNRMAENGRDLYAWLEEGAHFYVCGDANRMAKDVHQTLIDVVAEHGGKSPEDAIAYVDQLKKEKRYQRDVY